jgi:hypothetical protein
MKRTFVLRDRKIRVNCARFVVDEAEEGAVVTIGPAKRSLEQNAMLWVLLEQFSRQITWPVNGAQEALTPEEWKDILSAAFRAETYQPRVSPGLYGGGMVMLGQRTSRFSKREFSDFIEFIHVVAAERGVKLERGE